MLKIKKPPAPRRGAGRLFANILVNNGKSGFRRHENGNQSDPAETSCSIETGDEGIQNLIPRRHNAHVYIYG